MKTYFENSVWVVTASLIFMVVSFINSILGVFKMNVKNVVLFVILVLVVVFVEQHKPIFENVVSQQSWYQQYINLVWK